MTAAVVWLGFLLGLRHALEADHLPAVATLASRSSRVRVVAFVAAAWGFGHAAVLLIAGAVLVWSGAQWPPAVAGILEGAAGGVLVWLGIDVMRRASRDPVAVQGTPFATRALVIGGVHGVEGSGAVVLVALPGIHSPTAALGYLGAFGIGSIAGMVACSFAVSLPLTAASRLAGGGRTLQRLLGATSIAVGALLIAGYMRSILT